MSKVPLLIAFFLVLRSSHPGKVLVVVLSVVGVGLIVDGVQQWWEERPPKRRK